MFVSNSVHLHAITLLHETASRLREDLAALRATQEADARAHATERDIWKRAASAHEDTIAFLCARVNHLERTNGALFKSVTDIDVPVPEMRSQASPAPDAESARKMMDALKSGGGSGSIFEDMGDDAAKKAGIGWDGDGTVVYGAQPGSMKGEPVNA